MLVDFVKLHLHPYPPHRNSLLDLPATGLVAICGKNGHGKSSFVEAYAACVWGRSLRGAGPWRGADTKLTLDVGGYRVERTPESLLLNGASALKPSKKQADVTALFGDFQTWQRTRVFDADLTARFGAASDGDRKKLLEQLLGLEKLDDGLRRCREDKREAERQLKSVEQALYVSEEPDPTPVDFDVEALARSTTLLEDVERAAAKMAKEEGRLLATLQSAERKIGALSSGRCPTCEQGIPTKHVEALKTAAEETRMERAATSRERAAAAEESTRLLEQVRKLRAEQAAAERAVEAAKLRAERQAKRAPLIEQREQYAASLRQLSAVDAFIVNARPKLLRSSLAILEAAASAWLPNLSIGDDGSILHGVRTYKELNEGHRRLCDMAVLLGLSGMGDAKAKGPVWLDGALHGLDDERQDGMAALLETIAQRELVIVLTCQEDAAQRLLGLKIRVVDGRIVNQ